VLGTPAALRDLGSTNGTLVDGQRVSQIALVDGSTVQVGSTIFVYRTA
jgi:pSer/pThr/pTyr-binding forkhead associated (FHA) protein